MHHLESEMKDLDNMTLSLFYFLLDGPNFRNFFAPWKKGTETLIF